MSNPSQRRGFSLVELSIVLVILGLLVGGVLSGQSLIRASELRSVVTEHDRYYTAVRAFRDKYFALPGDMTNASQFWGLQAVGVPCRATPSTDTKTCNGDGNGKVDQSATSFEFTRFWQHLANAALIEGRYDGITNQPPSKLGGNNVWDARNYDYFVPGSGFVFDGVRGNCLHPDSIGGSTLNPAEVWNIDTKLDDGMPATGKIVVFVITGSGVSLCTDGANSTVLTANYLLTSTDKFCSPQFRDQY